MFSEELEKDPGFDEERLGNFFHTIFCKLLEA